MPHFYRYRGDDEDITARSRTPAPASTESRGILSYQYTTASICINCMETILPPPLKSRPWCMGTFIIKTDTRLYKFEAIQYILYVYVYEKRR